MIINKPENMSVNEAQQYVNYIQDKYNRKLNTINISLDGDFVDLSYEFAHCSFERIRRITGYLVGTLDSWNDGKKAEEIDRVKHDLKESL